MKKQWLTRTVVNILVLVMVFVMSACGGSGKTPTPTDKATEKPSAGTAPNELNFVTLDWYLDFGEAPDGQMVNDAVNEYLKEKVNANVNIYYWSTTDFTTNIPTMISSGQDLGMLPYGRVPYAINASRGAYYPMDELLDEYAPGTKALFPEDIWDTMRVDGKIYGIPAFKDNAYIMNFIYNADMADDLDLDMEKIKFSDWRQIEPFLMEVVEKRSEKFPEYDQYPLVGSNGSEMPYNFQVETFGVDLTAVANIEPFNNVAGYDSDTIFNLYETDEYREYAKSRQRMVENNIFAYDYTGKTEWNYTGGLFAWPGWGYTFMNPHFYGENFTTKMILSDRIWTSTLMYAGSGMSISANCREPERAMMILELINTDPKFATMMRFGIEGEHYVYDDEGKMTFEGSPRNGGDKKGYYHWYGAPLGNLTIVEAPENLIGPDRLMMKELERINKEAVRANHMGFALDTTPITNEIAATSNVVAEYQVDIRAGRFESEDEINKVLDEFIAKLKANGSEKIVEEVQRQVDEWSASR
ncbi:MAG: ABC transporter substrate-binding protein [Clostridiales bacterium]|nr:ABC transporter substrate-binding protein [Clostridiales bacterium]